MFVVIVGCSEVGYHLTKALLATGHEVVVIEKDQSRCQLLEEELGSVVQRGDGTDELVLRQAGAGRAYVVVAVTGRGDRARQPARPVRVDHARGAGRSRDAGGASVHGAGRARGTRAGRGVGLRKGSGQRAGAAWTAAPVRPVTAPGG